MICSDPADIVQYDHAHAKRVSALSYEIALRLDLPSGMCDQIMIAGLLHDIGKNKVSRSLLDKPGKLTPNEYSIVKTHCSLGCETIRDFKKSEYPWLTASLQAFSSEVALLHHERLDGSGYYGLYQISTPIRIVAVADVFDALINDRPYRVGFSPQYGLEYVTKHSGEISTQFDPAVVLSLHDIVKSGTPLEQAAYAI